MSYSTVGNFTSHRKREKKAAQNGHPTRPQAKSKPEA
jgi:hypothetical protein